MDEWMSGQVAGRKYAAPKVNVEPWNLRMIIFQRSIPYTVYPPSADPFSGSAVVFRVEVDVFFEKSFCTGSKWFDLCMLSCFFCNVIFVSGMLLPARGLVDNMQVTSGEGPVPNR